jgi:hypothetical protein
LHKNWHIIQREREKRDAKIVAKMGIGKNNIVDNCLQKRNYK